MNEPWAIESILNGTGGGGGGGNPIPPITNIYVPVESWKYQDRIIDVVGFPWVADVPYPNVKASDFVSVIYGQEDAESGIFSNVCDSRTDAVRIFASEKPSKRIRIDTLSGFRPNASNSIWGHITGDIQTQQDLVDFVGDSNKIESIKANGNELAIVDKAVNIPLATNENAGLTYLGNDIYNVYVSPDGDDTTGDGTQENPWREIQTAITNTENVPNKVVVINCARGEYQVGISISEDNTKNIGLNIDTEVTINDNISVGGGMLTINKMTSVDTTLNIITSKDIGIIIYGGVEVSSYLNNLNITAAIKGIRCVSKFTGVSVSGNNTRFISQRNVNINITGSIGLTGIEVQYLSTIQITNLTYTGVVGTAISVTHGPTIVYINSLTTESTRYSIIEGTMLSINGKWVNQS